MYFRKLIVVILFFWPTLLFADQNTITIINHYDQPLNFIIGLNPGTLSDLPAIFSLLPQHKLSTKVVSHAPEAYIRAEDSNNHFAFWGIDFDSHLNFHGYLSSGIAYSWQKNTITFCKPEDYQKYHGC